MFDHTPPQTENQVIPAKAGIHRGTTRSSAFPKDKFRGAERANCSHSCGRSAGRRPPGTGASARENTKNNTNEASMLLKIHDLNCKTNQKRTEKPRDFEGQMRRSDPKSELSFEAHIGAEALCPEIPKRLEAAIVRRRAGSRENTK
jgi:hypothetical protein